MAHWKRDLALRFILHNTLPYEKIKIPCPRKKEKGEKKNQTKNFGTCHRTASYTMLQTGCSFQPPQPSVFTQDPCQFALVLLSSLSSGTN